MLKTPQEISFRARGELELMMWPEERDGAACRSWIRNGRHRAVLYDSLLGKVDCARLVA